MSCHLRFLYYWHALKELFQLLPFLTNFYTTFTNFYHLLPPFTNLYYLPPTYTYFHLAFTNILLPFTNFILHFNKQKLFYFFFSFSSSDMHQSHHLVECHATGINSLLISFFTCLSLLTLLTSHESNMNNNFRINIIKISIIKTKFISSGK